MAKGGNFYKDNVALQTMKSTRSYKGLAKKRYSDGTDDDDVTPLINAEEGNGTASSPQPQGPDSHRSISLNLGKDNGSKSRTVSFREAEKVKNRFPANLVRNQKYNIITFLPIVLYEQFKFFFNLYFLLVALSQFVPALRIGYLTTYIAPLAFVLAVTIGKEAYDDYKRFTRDKEANSQIYKALNPETGAVTFIPSSAIRVGDLIIVEKNQRVPADLVLLRTEDSTGSCFVRTDQLDGETDWKLKLALSVTQKVQAESELVKLDAEIYAGPPIKDIHTFIGTFTQVSQSTLESTAEDVLMPTEHDSFEINIGYGAPRVEPLSAENALWANTVLASSGQVVGFVVYTGKDTRAVMNTSHPETKVGLLDLEINKLSKILCLVTFALSIALVALNGFRGTWYMYVFRFLILFSSIIPISLRVNLDMGKTVYAYQIMHDNEIPETIVRTSTIPEELGRIEYLLTDKTGTLTQNEMELKKLHMGTMSYGMDTMDEIISHLDNAYESRNKKGGNTAMSNAPTAISGRSRRDITGRIKDIVQALALCHNVTPVLEDDGRVTYQASSPDEVAIVRWTESVGLTLYSRDRTSMQIRVNTASANARASMSALSNHSEPAFVLDDSPSASPAYSDNLLSFDVLTIFPFTSETKRMGIIIRDRSTGEITFYEKGADTVMSKFVQYNDWLDEECGNMAREGLRTLVVARRKLSEEYYKQFERRYHQARISTSADRNDSARAVAEEMLEKDMELLGLTGVEDKLQDDVRTTLELLRNAGLKVWMLTGDKIETATCIAVSSKLVSRNQYIHQIEKLKTAEQVSDQLEYLRTKKDCCLVIDGESIQFCLDQFRSEFMEIATLLPAVVACRCSPTQKADITRLIKLYTKKKVCCIGDGGNDVSMIQAADVGVGIVGKEGKQASLAADFSITQFSFLTKLLVWHGRNSYKRSAKLAQFVIHRGLIISIIQAVFSAIFYFAPIALYQGWLMVGYATVYTMAPVFSLVLDRDVNEDLALLYPELYKDLTKGRSLSLKTFFNWLMISVYQGGAIMIMSLWLFENEFINIVSISFTALIFNELLMVALEITTWHPYMIISELATFAFYIVSMAFLPTYFDMSFILTTRFVWKVAVITAVSSVPLYVWKIVRQRYAPPSYTKLTQL